MALFSKQNKEAFIKPLNGDNPILVQVLGICSALAVTSQMKPAIVMGLAVTIITAFSNVIISIIRNTIPQRIRIIVQLGSNSQGTTDTKHLDEDRVIAVQWLDECLLILFTK